MNHKETVRAGYESIADRYLAGRTRDSADIQLLDELIRRLPAHARVLDAGCGAGIPVTQLLSERFHVVGVDFSEKQIELAKQNVPEAEFICQDMTQLQFADAVFGGICSYYAIIHIPREEHRSLLTNFHRMLKPGGLALVCLGAEHLVDDIDENYLGARMYWSHYDSQTYLTMLQEIGFEVVWSKLIRDETCEGGGHLFVLAQKP
jgi:ubiquinone/menaquinone biosynthesis C-methylase UbiE